MILHFFNLTIIFSFYLFKMKNSLKKTQKKGGRQEKLRRIKKNSNKRRTNRRKIMKGGDDECYYAILADNDAYNKICSEINLLIPTTIDNIDYFNMKEIINKLVGLKIFTDISGNNKTPNDIIETLNDSPNNNNIFVLEAIYKMTHENYKSLKNLQYRESTEFKCFEGTNYYCNLLILDMQKDPIVAKLPLVLETYADLYNNIGSLPNNGIPRNNFRSGVNFSQDKPASFKTGKSANIYYVPDYVRDDVSDYSHVVPDDVPVGVPNKKDYSFSSHVRAGNGAMLWGGSHSNYKNKKKLNKK